ncbi:bifunctional UDP-N-acetylglucosamine diphosphorylase/glucosamine-1-phosphate N-acetyltransferase GlmU [Facklamia sp. DSM 111018]|uniref:Bifunctional protein GlmU n=1 Tax=Facklamia lactis TaxID=2749967 RepID=A0ABS0LUP3_9LACT|nr:bifunctional UDP-N-acetylglucosamine diphosphorylase/glucosamine-1-phosphate N-acetyltransferase GlmU [Facklamia lactis]MBG9981433.1 bifunctional UDP-N-acetylglucosamine diphosphorylase/glucosamine-1-phosphate N-acetyltransferase GlmU [Facklamia lactis]MBG9987091.1 bifunctional UDP-N-acetylglucosamine diphosphorylase/glucosamine-1-phosphate N-acetyltransferase GlmU [Facklamia lactis]
MGKRMAVILAAGKGTRMKSSLPKVLHSISGLSMVEHVIRAVKQSEVEELVTIIGNGAEQVQEKLGDQTQFALQTEQLGTGHAVQQAENLLSKFSGNTLVICGDTPLLTGETLHNLFKHHEETDAVATILTAEAEDPTGYGRVIRDEQLAVQKIVEQKDASPEELAVKEINTGTYVFDNQALFEALKQVGNENAQGEYYLPDVIEIFKQQKATVSAYIMEDIHEGMGVNDRVALANAQRLMNERIINQHMRNGVTFTNPSTVYIESDVTIGQDSLVEGGVHLKGKTQIGTGCQIGSHTTIINSEIGDQVSVQQSVIEFSEVDQKVTIGPFAHLRPKSKLAEGVHIGNFVEVKNSYIGKNSKAGHLAYIGDADVGQDVNISCGVIFCNYDGKRKYRSVIGDQVFLGSNANIISPVEIGDRAFIAAGSTILKDVEEEALAISRSEQVNKMGYWSKFNNK